MTIKFPLKGFRKGGIVNINRGEFIIPNEEYVLSQRVWKKILIRLVYREILNKYKYFVN
jgi:hypothetical protein